MPNSTCCVCGTPVEGATKTLGGRVFCETHFSRVTRDRKGMWIASVALVAGLVLFVSAVFALAPLLRNGVDGLGLVIAGLVLALVPAVVWLGVFYLQDRFEPEPKQLLVGVFMLGALVANGVGQPLINSYFRVNEWASGNILLKLLAGIFVVGIIQEFLKYAAVRYSVFGSQEYDERVDGIIYGAAAGLGYATMLNVTYVVGNGGVDLGIGAVRIAITALAHASFSGVMGYFLGRAKFENRGPLWLPLGLLLSSVLNGVVTAAVGEITRSGLRTTPLNGLILSAVVAAATFLVLFVIIQRSNRATLAATQAGLSG